MKLIKKHAVRFIHQGQSRTYIVIATDTVDAICAALDFLEVDVPEICTVGGLAIVAKVWPEGAHLADEGIGPIIDTTRLPLLAPAAEPAEALAA